MDQEFVSAKMDVLTLLTPPVLPPSLSQYTISGKKVEVAVKQVIAGREVTQRGAFSNPASLDLYKNIPELQNY